MFDPHFLCGWLINTYSIAGPSPPSPLPSSLDSRIRTLFFSFLFLGLLDTDHFSCHPPFPLNNGRCKAQRFFLPLYYYPSSPLLCLDIWTLFPLPLFRFTCLGHFASDTFVSLLSPLYSLLCADLRLYRTTTRVWRRPPGWIVAVRRHAVLVSLPLIDPSSPDPPPPLPPLPFPCFLSPLLCATNSFV
jgi:hypothetical protein